MRRSLLALLPLILNACLGSNTEFETRIPTIDIATTTTPTNAPFPEFTPTTKPPPTLTETPTEIPTSAPPLEEPVQLIPLTGLPAFPDAEISGMAWYGDKLIILPQYPRKYISTLGSASLFALSKKEILDYLAGSHQGALETTQIPVYNSDVAAQIPGYEGFEAIAFNGDQVYLTIEANYQGAMQGYLIQGIFLPGENSITLDPETLIQIPTPVQIFNAAYETLFIADKQVITLFEANGKGLNSEPNAFVKVGTSQEFTSLDLFNIEYRLTDATDLDSEGRFWVLNVFVPIEFWFYSNSDPIIDQYGQGSTHAANIHVERLLELKYNDGQISLSGNPPIQIELIDDANPRNWEALVRIDDLGFLAMTDTYPGTILGFILKPQK
ncbi:MAG: hypothetical protein WBD62_17730 [Anaerolineales bacterium]